MTDVTEPPRVRCNVSALVLRHRAVALVVKREGASLFHSLPCGGQEHGETLVDAVQREFWEEVGLPISVAELLFVREYIGRNHEFAATDAGVHVVDHVFRCTLLPERSPNRAGAKVEEPPAAFRPVDADPDQVGVEWLPVEALDEYPFRPRALQEHLRALARDDAPLAPLYVGEVN